MNTTSILVDILIIGIQVLIWICGIIFSYIFNIEEVADLLKESTSISVLIILSVAYTFGIIFDYIIPATLKKLEKRIDKKNNVEKKKDRNVIDILNKNPEVHKFLDNHFSRLRIARATVFNIPLITISSILYVLGTNFSISCNSLTSIIAIVFLGSLLTYASYKSWERRKSVYSKYINRAYEIVEKK